MKNLYDILQTLNRNKKLFNSNSTHLYSIRTAKIHHWGYPMGYPKPSLNPSSHNNCVVPDRTTTGIIIVIIVVRAQDGYYTKLLAMTTQKEGVTQYFAAILHNSNDDIFGPWIVHCVCTMVHMRQKTHFLKKIVLLHPFHFISKKKKKKEKGVECQLINKNGCSIFLVLILVC